MKFAFIGFIDYPAQQEEIRKIVLSAGHTEVRNQVYADVLFVPHHIDKNYPDCGKAWIAVWVTGGRARLLELNERMYPPLELIQGFKEGLITEQPEIILDQLKRLEIRLRGAPNGIPNI